MTEVNTPSPMLPPPVEADARAERPRPRWLVALGTVLVGLVALVILSLVVPAQWLGRVVPGHAMIDDPTVAQKPGSARETATRVDISVDGLASRHPGRSRFVRQSNFR